MQHGESGTVLFPPRTQLVFYLLYVIVLCALLIAVCWRTGEPPRWRWGEER